MDDYYPDITYTNTQNISSCPNEKYFNIEFDYTNMYVLSEKNFEIFSDTKNYKFSNVSTDQLMQESTIESWLSQMDVPEDAFRYVVANIFKCARDMVKGAYMNRKVLSIRVVLSVTRASEDETDDEDDNDEEVDVDEENNGLIPAAKSCIEELEVVKVEKVEECAICFNDVIVGVPMPCLSHTFHMKCIRRWLNRGNSCPLYRFQLPTRTSE
jgi:hypothetical protein